MRRRGMSICCTALLSFLVFAKALNAAASDPLQRTKVEGPVILYTSLNLVSVPEFRKDMSIYSSRAGKVKSLSI
jgi:hypothetical protein